MLQLIFYAQLVTIKKRDTGSEKINDQLFLKIFAF